MAYQFGKISVLVVDDNKAILETVKGMLEVFGTRHIDTAIDGGAAFPIFCKHNHDLIITDWRMVPVDGLTFLNRVRTDDESPNSYVPVVMMTGYSNRERVLAARDMGITEFIVKPFSAHDLYTRIVQIVENPRQFVRANAYFGPDRRRRSSNGYQGPYLRETDVRPEDYNKEIEIILSDTEE